MQRSRISQTPSKLPPRRSPSGRKRPADDIKAARRQFWISITLAVVAIIIIVIVLLKFAGIEIFPTPGPTPEPVALPTQTESRMLEFDSSRKSSNTPIQERKIVILSDIEGAEIWLNGTFYGLTPLEINNPEPDIYKGSARIMNPKRSKAFTITVAESPPKTYTHTLNFMGGEVKPLSRPTATPKPKNAGIKVVYPETARYGKHFHVIVRPKPGLQIYGGFIKIMASCKQDSLRLEDAPSLEMVPYQGGVIRENLRADRCSSGNKDNKGLFYIILSTNQGTKTLGSPKNPYVVQYKR